MRGKRAIIAQCILYSGITPADAGKTNSAKSCRRSLQDHPRGCGENSTPNLPGTATSGSPPRMRGKRQPYVHCLSSSRDHPRGCGENSEVKRMNVFNLGSPPRMRGKLHTHPFIRRTSGITPADAGKTCATGLRGMPLRDHPRGCGENAKQRERIQGDLGSPPRMRGKPLFCVMIYKTLGITPADAGKTCKKCSQFSQYRDHPRGCGENADDFAACADQKGSPPRMRGKRFERYSGSQAERITPADAGKTCLTVTRAIGIWDHPRGCGENTKKIL